MKDRNFDYEVGDIVKLKKQHPCGHQVMLSRRLVEKNTRELKKKA